MGKEKHREKDDCGAGGDNRVEGKKKADGGGHALPSPKVQIEGIVMAKDGTHSRIHLQKRKHLRMGTAEQERYQAYCQQAFQAVPYKGH